MALIQDTTESDLFAAIGGALSPLFDAPIMKGLSNDVATPKGDYIVITPINQLRQGTNHSAYREGFRDESVQYNYIVQIDCYGLQSGNNANIINLLFRSDYFDASGIIPFYASEPRQLMFETGEKTMLERWTQDIHLSYNPTVALPQESATSLNVTLIEDVLSLP